MISLPKIMTISATIYGICEVLTKNWWPFPPLYIVYIQSLPKIMTIPVTIYGVYEVLTKNWTPFQPLHNVHMKSLPKTNDQFSHFQPYYRSIRFTYDAFTEMGWPVTNIWTPKKTITNGTKLNMKLRVKF